MKKMATKLTLRRETLKAMNPDRLADIAGGVTTGTPDAPEFPSQCSCCITECCC